MSSLIHMEVERSAWQGGPASEVLLQELTQLIQRCEAAGQELVLWATVKSWCF